MKIIISAKSSWENQLTVENVEQAVFDSGFDVREVLLVNDMDEVGKLWAEQENIPCKFYPIDWNDVSKCKTLKMNRYGKPYNPNAAKDRNQQLVIESDGMILFWHESDSTSEWLIKDMKKANKRIYFPKTDPEFIF